MVEYICNACDAVFETSYYTTVQRCPECLEWEAFPHEEPREGEIYRAWGEADG